MTRKEFEIRVTGKLPTDEEFALIETVYAFHPSISETDGKSQIAYIYNIDCVNDVTNFLFKVSEESDLKVIKAEKYGAYNGDEITFTTSSQFADIVLSCICERGIDDRIQCLPRSRRQRNYDRIV